MGKFVSFLEKIKYFVLFALNAISHCFDHVQGHYLIHEDHLQGCLFL
jgi:hypothetical protein